MSKAIYTATMNTENDVQELPPIEILTEQLEEETLTNLIHEFILREGTDYGAQEVTLDTKVNQVRRQIDKKEVQIFFDPNSETVNLVRKR